MKEEEKIIEEVRQLIAEIEEICKEKYILSVYFSLRILITLLELECPKLFEFKDIKDIILFLLRIKSVEFKDIENIKDTLSFLLKE